ncbi:MAG: antitoxin family protein [Anaerolineae bacterium]|nr:antitoxin family protein [Anaerolineae bacterium]
MAEIVTAVYENGLLRPLEPLDLRERQRVRIQVLPENSEGQEESEDPIETLIRRLIAEGRMRPRPEGPIPPDPLSEEERQALADRLGRAPGKLASEMVIEDRNPDRHP